MKRIMPLLGAFLAATIAFAQAPASGVHRKQAVRNFPFSLWSPQQDFPDTLYQNGIRYITLRPFQPWQQPVNDGKTVYLMLAAPQPRRDKAAPVHEAPNTPPPEPKDP